MTGPLKNPNIPVISGFKHQGANCIDWAFKILLCPKILCLCVCERLPSHHLHKSSSYLPNFPNLPQSSVLELFLIELFALSGAHLYSQPVSSFNKFSNCCTSKQKFFSYVLSQTMFFEILKGLLIILLFQQ